ncbi:universal stress protein [Halorientalis sp. IM1011]|uniref:universal stress protein n=1 Tax=Halorientalis sp. IM1011 TaxID=1932360 RepID=UPI00097CC7E3|nr:universal stress protein [Halorientalis sp. IM1011]AQL44234.1 universal stress protein [Halorientalis sp. IM1011]
MTLLVPFDGSDLSRSALKRASEFADYRGEEVVALTIIPDDEAFAQERGWIEAGETYDPTAVSDEFERTVQEVAPNATYRCEHPETSDSMTATVIDDITRTIRHVADDVDASIVFIGSENAGRVSTPVTSVGSPVSEDPRYDVHIVRHAD